MDFNAFVQDEEGYMKEIKGEDRYEFEKAKGSYDNLSSIVDESTEMLRRGLWIKEMLSIKDLKLALEDETTLAIAKNWS